MNSEGVKVRLSTIRPKNSDHDLNVPERHALTPSQNHHAQPKTENEWIYSICFLFTTCFEKTHILLEITIDGEQ